MSFLELACVKVPSNFRPVQFHWLLPLALMPSPHETQTLLAACLELEAPPDFVIFTSLNMGTSLLELQPFLDRISFVRDPPLLHGEPIGLTS